MFSKDVRHSLSKRPYYGKTWNKNLYRCCITLIGKEPYMFHFVKFRTYLRIIFFFKYKMRIKYADWFSKKFSP